MPFYAWQGITIQGTKVDGRRFARSQEELALMLVKHDVGLIGCRTIPYRLNRSINDAARAIFFSQLADLVGAGVLLPQALDHLAESIDDHLSLQQWASQLADRVRTGEPLYESLRHIAPSCSSSICSIIQAGEQAASLQGALQAVAEFLSLRIKLRAALWRAAIPPLTTLLFFLVVLVVIIAGIVPSFEPLFAQSAQSLPGATRVLIWLGSGSGVRMLIGVLIGIVLLIGFMKVINQQERVKRLWDMIALKTPIVGKWQSTSSYMLYCNVLALMLKNGVPLTLALSVAHGVVHNSLLKEQCFFIQQDVQSGISLGDAFRSRFRVHVPPHLALFASMGQDQSTVARLLEQLVQIEDKKMGQMVTVVASVVQPLLYLGMGAMIAFVLIGLYLPMFQLPSLA